MKTTLDLPDDLVQRVKFRAIQQKRKLREMMAILLEQGMAHSSATSAASLPKPVALKRRRRLNSKEIERAIDQGRI